MTLSFILMTIAFLLSFLSVFSIVLLLIFMFIYVYIVLILYILFSHALSFFPVISFYFPRVTLFLSPMISLFCSFFPSFLLKMT
jgi:hypothetical protein